MKRSTLPSESQVTSPRTAWCSGPLVEAMDRHDREELLDRPTVGNRLEDREIAEVGFGQQTVERVQLLGHFVGLAEQAADLAADRPKEFFRLGPLLQGHVAAAEKLHRHVERLLGVMVGFEHVPLGQLLVGLEQVPERLLGAFRQFGGQLVFTVAGGAQDVEHQHAMVGHDGPAAFGENLRDGAPWRRRRHSGYGTRRRWRIPGGCS